LPHHLEQQQVLLLPRAAVVGVMALPLVLVVDQAVALEKLRLLVQEVLVHLGKAILGALKMVAEAVLELLVITVLEMALAVMAVEMVMAAQVLRHQLVDQL
jgi:hypothetical protein